MTTTTLMTMLMIFSMAPAGVSQEAAAARTLAEELAGGRLAPEALDRFAAKLSRLATSEGNEALELLRRDGARSLRILEKAGDSPAALRLLARHGDEAAALIRRPLALRLAQEMGDPAAAVLGRHPVAGEAVLACHGAEALPALERLSSRQARRLALMTEDGSLRRMGRTEEVLEVLGRLGDGAMDFVWRHKGALSVAAALTAFLNEPEAFINGARDLAAEAVQPATVAAREFGRESGKRAPTLLASLAAVLFAIAGALFLRRSQRDRSAGM